MKPAPRAKVTQSNVERTYAIEFAIAGLPKTPNALLGAPWQVRAGHAKKWQRYVELAIGLNGALPATPLKRAEVWLTRCSSGSLDDEGLRGSFKAVVDALVRLGVLEDDSPKHMLAHYAHEKAAPRGGSIRVRVEEVP